jgi:hypothetical protein
MLMLLLLLAVIVVVVVVVVVVYKSQNVADTIQVTAMLFYAPKTTFEPSA